MNTLYRARDQADARGGMSVRHSPVPSHGHIQGVTWSDRTAHPQHLWLWGWMSQLLWFSAPCGGVSPFADCQYQL